MFDPSGHPVLTEQDSRRVILSPTGRRVFVLNARFEGGFQFPQAVGNLPLDPQGLRHIG